MLITLCDRNPRGTRVFAATWLRNPRETRLLASRIVLAIGLVALCRDVHADQWDRLGEETADLLAELVQVDTQNPPGNETPAARVLARKLEADGVASEIFESSPQRGNLYARLPGSGVGRPIVLLAHLDVVPADPRGWRVPPLSGVRKDGYLWGRGTLDAKGVAAVQAMTVIALKRSGRPLPRDVILLATADEETGGHAGAGWVTAQRPDLVRDAEYLLTEGDHVHVRPRGRKVVQVAVAEKTPCWVKLVAHGEAGHGSAPARATAVTRLVHALERVSRIETEIRVVDPVADYFAAIAPLEGGPLRPRLENLRQALADPAFREEFTRNPHQNALVRNTITPTVLEGSVKTNVIPGEASAHLDCRLLPGDRPEDFLALLRSAIGDDGVQIEPLLSFPASSSDSRSPLVTALRRVADTELDGAPVIPSVITGFTDSHYFRELGIASYGFVPFVLTEADQKTVHGIDERVSLENLRDGVRRLLSLLRALSPATAS
jgi:acetylornithine deacetylase/succinyl-diaminopimelate desuccinylase-like protein